MQLPKVKYILLIHKYKKLLVTTNLYFKINFHERYIFMYIVGIENTKFSVKLSLYSVYIRNNFKFLRLGNSIQSVS